ncbi:hypothetical protein FRB94_012590 [Tulasnella sp. JGI-2019a]|nr:hypothetical protein FRB93_001447 [Tulasnella sp. JGI-2019a]KAG9009065.1 hypothetical protein FRB94_012590 [Tulasnella sp. JGI-2019a]KAG9030474.1 hypothetical protein FRB95_003924 [Tulasnella sp. JGI-2019a]
MLALAPPQSVMHHTASVSSRTTSSSIRTSRTTSPPRKPVQAHRTPTHTLVHSTSVPSSSSSSSSAAGPSVRPPAPASASIISPPSTITPPAFDVNSLPQADLLRLLSQLLQRIASSNDKIYHAHSQAQQAQPETQSRHYPVPSPDDPHPAYSTSVSAATPLFASLTTASRASVGSPTCPLFFHARNVPTISIESYLLRILKYCPTTNEVFLSLLVYFDRMGVLAEAVTKELDGANEKDGDSDKGSTMPLIIDSYNIHRLIIAGVTVASKFFSDVFYTNSRYAKVGGLPTHELNKLELQFLLLNDFRLVISAEELQRYAEQLIIYCNDPASSGPPSSSTLVNAAYSSPSMELFHQQSEIPHLPPQPPLVPVLPAATPSSSQETSPSLSGPDTFSPLFSSGTSSSASSIAPTPTSTSYDHFTPSSSTSTITQGAYGPGTSSDSEYIIPTGTEAQTYGNEHNGVYGVNRKDSGWDSASVTSADSESLASNSEAGETSVEEEPEEEPTIRFIKHGLINGVEMVESEGRNTPQRRASHPALPSFSGYNDDDDDDDDDEEVKIITHDHHPQPIAAPALAAALTMRFINGNGRSSLKRGVDDGDDDADATEDEVVYRGDRDSRGPSRTGAGRSGGSAASRS